MKEPIYFHYCYGGVAMFGMWFESEGDSHVGHEHTFNHPTLLAYGSVGVESNGKTSAYTADRSSSLRPFVVIPIPRAIKHRVFARQDRSLVICVQALHDRDNPGDIIEVDMFPAGTPDWSKVVPLTLEAARKAGFNF